MSFSYVIIIHRQQEIIAYILIYLYLYLITYEIRVMVGTICEGTQSHYISNRFNSHFHSIWKIINKKFYTRHFFNNLGKRMAILIFF